MCFLRISLRTWPRNRVCSLSSTSPVPQIIQILFCLSTRGLSYFPTSIARRGAGSVLIHSRFFSFLTRERSCFAFV
eukprot:c30667_g1_i1 orf=2-226(-)